MITATMADRFSDGMLGFLLGMLITFIACQVFFVIPLMRRKPPGA